MSCEFTLKFLGGKCPHCGHWYAVDIDDFTPQFGPDWAVLPLCCHHCGTTWNATYKFDHNEEIDVLETREEA